MVSGALVMVIGQGSTILQSLCSPLRDAIGISFGLLAILIDHKQLPAIACVMVVPLPIPLCVCAPCK